VIILGNVAAIRLEVWRHKVADTFIALEYIRVADLIRLDIERVGTPRDAWICVDGLDALPYAVDWERDFALSASARDYNMSAILAQALGRRDVSRIRLDCGAATPAGAILYAVHGAAVFRDGQSIDGFDELSGRVRALVVAGDYRAARTLLQDRARMRPFIVRYMLEHLPDGDVTWITNGQSLLVWLDRIAGYSDHWYLKENPSIDRMRRVAADEVRAYIHVLFFAELAEARTSLATPGVPLHRRFPWGGVPMRELSALLREDQVILSSDHLRDLLDHVAAPPIPAFARASGYPRQIPALTLFWLLGRLLWPLDPA
ncbi:MAG TPA: hypothetical protein VML54_04140, partial [Candidatus Limnocylindrales bacterium]|nr:hypothetical protein [Candidatus Limnocylindrales bacterium]